MSDYLGCPNDARSAQAEDGGECFVDAPQFFRAEVAYQFAETSGVDRTDLFDQDARVLPGDLCFGAKRRSSSASRGRGNNHHRSREELVGLNNDAITIPVLFAAYPFG